MTKCLFTAFLAALICCSALVGCSPKKTAEQNAANAEAEKVLQAENAELKAQLEELEASKNQQSKQEETAEGSDKEKMLALSEAKLMDFNRVQKITSSRGLEEDESADYEYTMEYMDKIDVLGWSKKGLLAYRYISDGGGRSGFNQIFVIVDTVTDTVIVNEYFNDSKAAEEHERNAYRDKWNSLLEKHGIAGGKITDPCAAIDENKATAFPLGAYDCWFDYSMRDAEHGSQVYSWRLTVGNNAVQKVITRQVSTGIFNRMIILGYYKSPFENRIAILVSGNSRLSGTLYFEPSLYGCNMDVGLTN